MMRVSLTFWLSTIALVTALPLAPRVGVSSWAELKTACTSNGTVVISPGFKMTDYDSNVRIQGSLNIVIEGNGAVFDAASGFFDISVDYTGAAPTVSITNLTMMNSQGNAPGATGGAISLGGGTVTIKDCTFAKNGQPLPGYISGGAIGVLNGVTNIISSTFDSNTANRGGAIYAVAGEPGKGKVTVSQCHFKGNQAASAGGAILADRANVTVEDSTFEDNLAPGDRTNFGGGAIGAYYHSSILIKGSAFAGKPSSRRMIGQPKIGFNDVHHDDQGGSVSFACEDGKQGKPVPMKVHDLSPSQLPPATEVAQCH